MPMSRPSPRPPIRPAGAPPSRPRAATLLALLLLAVPAAWPPGTSGPGPVPLAAQSPALPSSASGGTGAGPGPAAATAAEVGLLLRQMSGVKRLLVIGAHPDDEDTALLAEMDRRRGVRAAYLSLTRGEGGQNLIGPELGKGLGLLRTGELLAARRLDGAEQFFSRAYDFGFSKTARETFRHWPRDSLLSDVVWVIRTFRPQVVVSVFAGTPADGHGQHQVAGMLAREAFEAAADTARFPEHFRMGASSWQVSRLYSRTWRYLGAATVRIATGRHDPLLGRSPFQLAMESRSQHRSQDFGVARPPGERFTRLRLLEDRTGAPADAPLFAGVDTTLAGVLSGLPPTRRRAAIGAVETYGAAVAAARDSLRVMEPGAAVPPLAAALEAIGRARREAAEAGRAGAGALAVLERKRALAARALLAAGGVSFRVRSEEESWVSGRTVRVHAELWNGGSRPVRAGPPSLRLPPGWEARLLPADSVEPTPAETSPFYEATPAVAGGASPLELRAGGLARWTFRVDVPRDAPPDEAYFLRRDTVGDLYRWPEEPTLRARPLDPPTAGGRIPVRIASGEATARSPARYRGVDKARGEFWRPVRVVPRVSVGVSPGVLAWPVSGTGSASAREDTPGAGRASGAGGSTRPLSVEVRSLASGPLEADLRIEAPEGWEAVPERLRVELAAGGATARREIALRPAPGSREAPEGAEGSPINDGAPGGDATRRDARVRVAARVRDGPLRFRELRLIDYPHVDPVPFYREAAVRVERFPLRVDRDRRVGYVVGSGDGMAGALRQLGLQVESLGPERLRAGDFEALDVIVLGVRAYEVREDLAAANRRLLDWVREGGTLLVQYNKYEFEEGGYAPYPVTMTRPHDRVTDETAPVTLLHPDSPPLRSPNRIGPEDFRGWIQERGLYFLHTWDARYVPLLEMADPGEEPIRGGLLVAPVGQGLYVYTGLAFFRQLPHGVPGAWRLFANLVSLEPGEWREWAGDRSGGKSAIRGDATPLASEP